jgi:hypothetical protein
VIEKYRPKAVFPVNLFQSFGASALIALELGSRQEGAEFARRALAAAAAPRSPFPRHSDIGLVGSKYDDLRAKLQELCRETPGRSK